jgi:ketosteroid isomerase-like protein
MTQARDILERTFRALESRDRVAALACFAPDAVLFDPHYPQPRMEGIAEIAEGLDWGLSVMKRFGFRTKHVFGSHDGLSGAFEVDTDHTLNAGQNLKFPQVFVVETRDGLITALRAYEPYGPNGIGGIFLGLARLRRRLAGKKTV